MEARKGGRRSSLLRLTEGRSLGFARGSSGDPAGSPVGDPKGPVKFASWATLADRRSFGFEGKPKGNRPGPQGLGRNPLQGTASRPHRLGVPDRGQWGLAAMPAPIRVWDGRRRGRGRSGAAARQKQPLCFWMRTRSGMPIPGAGPSATATSAGCEAGAREAHSRSLKKRRRPRGGAVRPRESGVAGSAIIVDAVGALRHRFDVVGGAPDRVAGRKQQPTGQRDAYEKFLHDHLPNLLRARRRAGAC